MAETITTQSTTIKRIVHDPSRNRVLMISAAGIDIYRVTDWTRIAWAAIANATCGAINDNGIYIGTSTSGVYRLPLAATGAATSQLVSVFNTGAAVELSSYDIKDIAGHGGALAIVTASEFVYLPNPATGYDGPSDATAVAMNGTYLAWATSNGVKILNAMPTADWTVGDATIPDVASRLSFESGTDILLICHEDGLRVVDCADPVGGGGYLPTDSLISHWTMDAVNGSTVYDERGSADGTLVGSATVGTTVGQVGAGLGLDGADSCMTFGSLGIFEDSLSFACWVHFDVETPSEIEYIWRSGEAVIGCRRNADGTLYFLGYNATDGTFGAQTAGSYGVGTYHIVGRWTKGSKFELFVNGTLAKSTTTSSSPEARSEQNAIGANKSTSQFVDGWIDEFRFFSGTLTDAEIASLYAEGINGYGINYDSDLGTVTDCQDAMKRGDYVSYGTSNGSDGGRFGILLLDAEGAATSKTTVASTDTDNVWIAAGATEAIYNNQLERYRLAAEISPGSSARDVRRDWTLYAEITDALGGIQSGTVALKVNGISQTPTASAITDGYSVTYTPAANSGYAERVTIEISGTDSDGNTVSRTWVFTTVVAPALTATDAAPPNVKCIRDIGLTAAEADGQESGVNVIWIDTHTSPLIVTEAQAREVGRVKIDEQTYHRHTFGVKVLATDAADLQTRDLQQGSIVTVTCNALDLTDQKCEVLAVQRSISDGDDEDISFNILAAYYEEV